MVVAVVRRIRHLDFDIQIGQLGLDDLRDVDDLVVFEAEVEGAAIDLVGRRFHEDAVEVDHVGHADIRAPLLPAMHSDDTLAQGVGGQLVDGQIEALTGRVSANGSGADVDRAKFGASRGENKPLGERFVFRVVGQRLRFETLVDFRFGARTEDAGRRGVDETFHAGFLGQGEKHSDGIEVDLTGQDFVDIAGRIVGNRGQMDHRVASGKSLTDFARIAEVAADQTEALLPFRPLGIRLEGIEARLRVQHEIENTDVVSERKKVRNETATDVAEATSDEDF